jgi:ABC-type oligopeptide transport system substrate-binding subunit
VRNRFLQRQWQDVLGVETRLDVVDWREFLFRLGRRPYHLVNLNWLADYPNPDNYLRVSRLRAWPAWRDDAYNRLVHEARGLTEGRERMARYRQAEEILVREAPILPLVYERDHLLLKPRLSRYPMSAIRPTFWKDAVIAEGDERSAS